MRENNNVHTVKYESENLSELGFDIVYYPKYINTSLRQHAVSVLLFSIFMNGKANHYIGKNKYIEKEPSLNIIHYNQTHDIVTDKSGVEVFNLFLDPERINYLNLPVEFHGILSTILPLHLNLLPQERKLSRIKLSNPKQFRHILLTLKEELEQKHTGYRHICEAGVNLFLVKVCQEAKIKGVETYSADNVNFPVEILNLKDYLFKNFKEEINLKMISKKTHYSIPQLCRLFKKLTGKPIMVFVIERRIEMALELLRHSDLKIMDIAFTVGFCDVHFFNRKFKALIGETASSYRKKWRQKII